MALFFNLDVLESEAKGDSQKFLAQLEYFYKGVTTPSNKSKYKPSRKSLRGYSYLLNPAPLFLINDVDILYIVQYIKLAARRDFALFKFHGSITLDLSYFPDLDLNKIKTNPLLKVVNKHIHFKFEEIYNGTKIRRHQGQGS
jgi:hypothetical protein